MNSIPDTKRRSCADQALHAYGTAYIFERRAATLRNKLRAVAFLGIAGPASVGAIIGTYNLSPEQIRIILGVAGTIAVVQLMISIWSLTSGWDRDLSDFLELKNENYELSRKYEEHGNATQLSIEQFQATFNELDKVREYVRKSSDKHDVSEKEKRMGMRYALRKFQRPCAGCGIVPKDLKSTDCGVCGSF